MRVGWGVCVRAFKCTCTCVDYAHVHAGVCIRCAYVGVCPCAQVYMHICGICISACRCVYVCFCIYLYVHLHMCRTEGKSGIFFNLSILLLRQTLSLILEPVSFRGRMLVISSSLPTGVRDVPLCLTSGTQTQFLTL